MVSELHYCVAIIVICIDLYHMANATCDNLLPSKFVHQPADIIVVEGANASFVCSVSNFNQETDTLSWNMYPSHFQTVQEEKYNQHTGEITKNLLLINVDRRFQQQYCELRRLDVTGHLQICHSQKANYTTWFFPTKEELACGPQNIRTLTEIESVEIWCRISQGNPPVDLSFIREGLEIPHQKFSGSSSIGIKINLTDIHSTAYGNITCLVTGSGIFQNKRLICSISLSTAPTQSKTSLDKSHNTSITIPPPESSFHCVCVKEFNPKITHSLWSCMPLENVEGCHSGDVTFHFPHIHVVPSFLGNKNTVIVSFTRYHTSQTSNISGNGFWNSTCLGDIFSSECFGFELTFLQTTLKDDRPSGHNISLNCSLKHNNSMTEHQHIMAHCMIKSGLTEEKQSLHQEFRLLPHTSYTCSEVRLDTTDECMNSSSNYPLCYCSTRSDVNKEAISAAATQDLVTLNSTAMSPRIRSTENHVYQHSGTTIKTSDTKRGTVGQINITTVIAITAILLSILLPLITAVVMHWYHRYGQINVSQNNSLCHSSLSQVRTELSQEQGQQAITAEPPYESQDVIYMYEDPTITPENHKAMRNLTNLQTTDVCYASDNIWNKTSYSYPSSGDPSSDSSFKMSSDFESTLSDSYASSNISNLTTELDPFYENRMISHAKRHTPKLENQELHVVQ